MICQDRLETNLLQLFAHTQNSEWFSMISVTVFKINFVAESVNAKRMTITVHFYTELKQTVLNLWYVKITGVRREETGFVHPHGNWD